MVEHAPEVGQRPRAYTQQISVHLGDVKTTSALWVLSLLLTDDEGDCSEGHDHGAHQEVRQRQRHQEVVGGALQLPG